MRALPRLCLALSLLVSGLTGCEENLDPTTPDGALHRLRDAVMARDAQAILAVSSATTQRSLAQLHTRLKELRQTIDDRYPSEHQAAARAAFPEGVLEAPDSASLFAKLLAPQLDTLDPTPGLAYGLTAAGRPTVTEDRATVPTQSGETIELLREDGEWRTTVFERALEQNLNRVKLDEQTLSENLKVFEELKRREAERQAADAEAP